MLVDSHCHLNRLDFSKHNVSVDAALKAARDQGVEHFLAVSVRLDETPQLMELAQHHDDIACSAGVHPNDGEQGTFDVDTLRQYCQRPEVIAVGETGLDYYRTGEAYQPNQRNNFREQIRLARECGKPLIIHTRSAVDDTLQILREERAHEVGGIFHCFTESWEMAQAGLDMNFYVSMSGIVTFKNAKAIQEVAKKVPDDRLLIETDAPYLAPVPNRGKPNEPAYVRHTAEFLAELRGVDFETLAQQTTQNYYRLFQDWL